MPRPARAQATTRFALEVTPGAPCLSRASLTGYLQALFGGDPVDPPSPATDTVVVGVRGHGALRVDLRLRRAGSAAPQTLQRLRERSSRCEQLLASVASVLHEHLTPIAAPRPTPAPPPPATPVAASSRSATVRVETLREVVIRSGEPARSLGSTEILHPPGETREQPAGRIGFRVALEGYGAWGVLPTWSGGLRFTASVRLGPRDRVAFVVGLGGRFDLPVSTTFEAGGLESRALGGDLLLCARWKALDACALGHLGVSSSQLANGAAGAETTSRWSVGAQLGGTLHIAGRIGLRASVEALAVPVVAVSGVPRES